MSEPDQEEQEARDYQAVVEPLLTEPLYEALRDRLPRPEDGQVLVAEARCGFLPLRLVESLPASSRIIALDPSRPMLDRARQRLDDSLTRRVFFVHQRLTSISYADGVFQASICLHGIITGRHALEGLCELARVTAPGGHVVVAAPFIDSFSQMYDMLDEALRAQRHEDAAERVRKTQASLLSPGQLAEAARQAGLHDATMHELRWRLAFDSGRHLLTSPLIRETFFAHWIGAVRSDERGVVLRYMADAHRHLLPRPPLRARDCRGRPRGHPLESPCAQPCSG